MERLLKMKIVPFDHALFPYISCFAEQHFYEAFVPLVVC